MPRMLSCALVALLALTAVSLPRIPEVGAQAPAAQGIQAPAIPDPVAVSLDASTTAFLALDFLQSNCGTRPACVATLPAVAAGITAARSAKVLIVYSAFPNATILPDVLQQDGDPTVTSSADKFFGTNLDDILKQHGITTVVVTGTSSNGAVLYTSFGAAARGYTVVVAVDGITAATDFGTFYTEWQLLNGPGTANAQNTPLQPKAVTLSRTDLLSYK